MLVLDKVHIITATVNLNIRHRTKYQHRPEHLIEHINNVDDDSDHFSLPLEEALWFFPNFFCFKFDFCRVLFAH